MDWDYIKRKMNERDWSMASFLDMPDSANSRNILKLSNILRKARRFEEALSALEVMLSGCLSEEDRCYAYHLLGEIRLDQELYSLAEEAFSKVIEIRPCDDMAFNNRGLSHWEREQFDQALLDYKSASELNPDNFVAWRGLGEMYLKRSEYQHAKNCLLKALAINPNYSEAAATLKQVLDVGSDVK